MGAPQRWVFQKVASKGRRATAFSERLLLAPLAQFWQMFSREREKRDGKGVLAPLQEIKSFFVSQSHVEVTWGLDLIHGNRQGCLSRLSQPCQLLAPCPSWRRPPGLTLDLPRGTEERHQPEKSKGRRRAADSLSAPVPLVQSMAPRR